MHGNKSDETNDPLVDGSGNRNEFLPNFQPSWDYNKRISFAFVIELRLSTVVIWLMLSGTESANKPKMTIPLPLKHAVWFWHCCVQQYLESIKFVFAQILPFICNVSKLVLKVWFNWNMLVNHFSHSVNLLLVFPIGSTMFLMCSIPVLTNRQLFVPFFLRRLKQIKKGEGLNRRSLLRSITYTMLQSVAHWLNACLAYASENGFIDLFRKEHILSCFMLFYRVFFIYFRMVDFQTNLKQCILTEERLKNGTNPRNVGWYRKWQTY